MDIDQLRTFVAITETGSFTAAGHRVGRTQSAVSQQIKKLEDELGGPLLDRRGGAVSLTQHGKRLVAHARDVLEAHGRALEAFDLVRGTGRLSLGMPEIYADALLSRILPELRRLAPEIEISLTMANSVRLKRMLSDGQLDLAFLTDGEIEPPSGPVIFSENAIWIGAVGLNVADLTPLPVVVWGEGSNYRRTVLAGLERVGRPYRVAMTTQSFGGMISAIRSGIGVGAATRFNTTDGLTELGPESGLPPLRKLNVHLERRDRVASPLVRRIEHQILQFFGIQSES